MARRVVLDGMITRADFAQQTESASIELFEKLTISQLVGQNPILRMLRKPDFQRETNHWTPEQVATFISSFANGGLIPSLILWKSNSHIFVIDGGHRLSALRAWIENDYGDGTISYKFYDGQIPQDQKNIAKRTQNLVERRVGRFKDFESVSEEESNKGTDKAIMASTIFTKAILVQWIQGSQEVAEDSFFKINSQGTPLDPVESLLLQNRKKSYAISARSIIRAGTGNRYWSDFSPDKQMEIEEISRELFELLFQPDVKEPIRTLDLPLGGTTSPVDVLKMLLDTFSLVDGKDEPEKAIAALANDPDGNETIAVLKSTRKVVRRMTGTSSPSLGLHPAIYFYNEQGKHSRFLFLGVVKAFADSIRNNNSQYFHDFTDVRSKIENILITKKYLINQGLSNINSRQRINRVSALLSGLIKRFKTSNDAPDEIILSFLGLTGEVANLKIIDGTSGFSNDVKSAVYLRESLKSAMRCPICQGYLDPSKAVSYDHVERRRDGGTGSADNLQLAHPFCNSGVKS